MSLPRITLLSVIALAFILFLPDFAAAIRGFSESQRPSPSGGRGTRLEMPPAAASHSPKNADSPAAAVPVAVPQAAQPLVFGENGPVTLEQIPPGRFRKELLALPAAVRASVLARLGEQRIPIIDLRSLHIDATGMLFYTCSALAVEDAGVLPAAAFAPSEAPVPINSPPARSSRPGSPNVIYLDFNGHIVSGTAWSSSALHCVPYDTDGDPSTFSDYEQAQIIEVWERVAEDFRPFNVNVTTVEPPSFSPTTARALITRNVTANGTSTPNPNVGGVAYVGVFGQSNFHTTYSPAFAYYNRVGGTAANIAEVVSHEVGHNFGLNHDGISSNGYYGGHGTGESSWGPIMGNPYGRNFTQWSKGDYKGANNKTQDDIAVIAAKTGNATDDVPASIAGANLIPVTSGSFLAEGFSIGTGTDVDIHRIDVDQGSVTVNAESFKVPGGVSYGANLGIQLELLSAAGNLIAAAPDQGRSTASISTTVAPGTYYIRVAGTGNGSPLASPPTGFNSYGSMGAYRIYGTIGGGNGSFSPQIATGNATATTLNATTLSATVNPRGLSTGVFFQYGTSETFGANSATVSAGSGSSNQTVQIPVSGLLPSTTYYYRAAAQNSAGTSYGATLSFQTISNSTALQSLSVSQGTLSPIFSSATRNYSVTVPHGTDSLVASWTPLHPSAVAQVRFNTGNFTTAPGGTYTANFALSVGNNTATIRVTAQDGTTSGNHTLRIVRQRSSDTALSSLTLGAGVFAPSFNPSTANYTLGIPNAIGSTTINATKSSPGGKIEARVGNGTFVLLTSGRASSAFTLAPGNNLLQVRVTADDGTTTASHFFAIARAASGTALANLVPRWNTMNLTLSPAFSSNTSSYGLTVANSVSSVTVLPTLAEANSSAAVRVGSGNFTAIAAGKASAALALSPGSNTVEVRVLSDDKVASRTYSLVFQRLGAPVANPAGMVTLNGTTLSGTIDARSSAAAFQLGRTTTFGTTLPVSFMGGNGTAAVSTSTGPLAASALYYFRLTAQHGGITDNGTTGSFLTPVRVALEPLAVSGGNATGIVPGAKFTAFGNATINVAGDMAFYATANFTGANATNNAGIWKTAGGAPQLVARIGANATGGGVFSALGEPVLDGLGRTTFIGSLRVGTAGVVTVNATGIWQVSANGSTSLIARAGTAAPGAAGTVFSSFTNLVVGEGGVAFRAVLGAGTSNVTAANNAGVWAQNASGNLVLVARLGAAPTPSLGNFTVFNAEAGQAGHSRHFNGDGDLLFPARFGTGALGVYKVNAYGFTFNGTAPIAAVGSAVPGVIGGLFSAISNPILGPSDEVAFRATFTGNGVATGNNTAIFAYSANGSGRLVVRTGGADSGGRLFQTLSSPILNGAGNIAFTGTLRSGVGGVSTANATGVWTVSPDGPVAIVARAGDEAPGTGGARFATFPQISYPDEAGIAFTATLAGTGITTTNNNGLWASPSPGAPLELVLRTGDSFLVGGVAKTVSSFSAYAASAATAGAGRGFNAFGDVVFLVTFSDGARGIFKFEMP